MGSKILINFRRLLDKSESILKDKPLIQEINIKKFEQVMLFFKITFLNFNIFLVYSEFEISIKRNRKRKSYST